MSSPEESVPIVECAPPGTVAISPAAMALAERFQAAVPAGFIVAFSWHDGERVRASKDAPWVDKGPGVGLGAYRTIQIPEEAVCHSSSINYAVLIRQAVLDDHPEKRVYLDDTGRMILK